MKKFISFSGGVESTTMLILYGGDAEAIWCDTGAEHNLMYARIDEVETAIKEIHPNFILHRVKSEKHGGLEEYAAKVKFMPSGQARYCTRLFKIEPIDNFLSQQGECQLMIGFNADEENRTGNLEKQLNVNYIYPLIEDGLTRADCEDVLRQHGLHPNFPPYMKRGGCRMCFFKSEKEYKAMYFLNKEEFLQVVKFEQDIQDKRLKFYSIMGNGKSLTQLAEECERERALLPDIADYYRIEQTFTSCGAFCHR